MVKAIAIHKIQGGGIDAAPGTPFEIDDAGLERLIALGAAKLDDSKLIAFDAEAAAKAAADAADAARAKAAAEAAAKTAADAAAVPPDNGAEGDPQGKPKRGKKTAAAAEPQGDAPQGDEEI